MADVDERAGACITAQLVSTGSRLMALQSLMILKGADDEILGYVRKFVTDTKELGRRRNRVVHDHWLEDDERNMYRYQVTADPKPIHKLRAVPLSAIREVADAIDQHVHRYIFMRFEILKRLMPELYAAEGMQGYGLSLPVRPKR